MMVISIIVWPASGLYSLFFNITFPKRVGQQLIEHHIGIKKKQLKKLRYCTITKAVLHYFKDPEVYEGICFGDHG